MYIHLKRTAAVAATSLVVLALSACDIAVNGEGGLHFDVGARAQDEWSRTYKLGRGGRLELININGRITAEPGDGDAVELRAERVAKAATEDAARQLLSRIEMREEVSGERVRVEVRPPQIHGPSHHEMKWTVKVPKGVSVDLRTVNGGVKLTGLTGGEVRARSTNGGITGDQLTADSIDASVTNGGVEISLAGAPSPTGSIDLESVNGGVSLALPADSKADVSARCVNGGISVNGLELEIVGEKTRRRLDGKLNGGGTRVSLETTNGGVHISRATT